MLEERLIAEFEGAVALKSNGFQSGGWDTLKGLEDESER